jgi:uroporphyrinogen decarboxylase
MLRFLRREPYEYFPNYMEVVRFLDRPQGFREHPAHNTTGKDWFGVEWVYDEAGGGIIPDPGRKPVMDDITKWESQVKFPDLDAWNWENCVKEDHLEEIDREKVLLNVWSAEGLFERLHALMGFEEALVAIATEPEATGEFFAAMADYKCKLGEKIIKYYKPDIIQFMDDWGSQQNLFFSPETWRKLIKPQVKRIVDLCHKHGIIYEQHSCGMVESIVPEWLDIGIDIAFIMGINNMSKLKSITGNKIVYVAGVKIQEYTAKFSENFDEEALRAAVREEILPYAKGGNYTILAGPVDAAGKPDRVRAVVYDEIIKNIDNMTKLIKA